MKVFGYIRVSTDGQGVSGLGLADQEAKVRGYCDLYGLELIEVVKDIASGKSLLRPGLQGILEGLHRGDAEGVVVAKLDRLTRSVKDMGALLDSYFRDRFGFFVVQEQIDTRSASGRFVLNLLTSVAEWERETIGERTKAAMAQKKARMEYIGGRVPFGYDITPEKGLVENPMEQSIIERIKSLRAKGLTLQEIADDLNNEGLLTKTQRPWSFGTVARVLKVA